MKDELYEDLISLRINYGPILSFFIKLGELIQVGDTTVPDTTNSVKAAAADHLAAKTLYGAYGYGGYGLGYGEQPKRRQKWSQPGGCIQSNIGGGAR